MKIVSFGPPGEEMPGVLEGERILDLGRADPSLPPTVGAILEEGLLPKVRALAPLAPASAWIPARGVRLGPPVTDPTNIVCLGLNYRDHAEESKMELPKSPILFSKAAASLSGPFDPIRLGPASKQVDIEVELAVVIGSRARGVPASEALSIVAGYTMVNDVSGRDLQFGDKQWFRGKSQDTYCPCGPFLATLDEVPDPGNLRLASRVNGETWQSSSTRNLVFAIPKIIEFVTEGITLYPGDLIATGTPAGVGFARTPPRFLKPGDLVEIEVERLGLQRCSVVP